MQMELKFEFEGVAIARGLNKPDDMVEMSQELMTWFHSKKVFTMSGALKQVLINIQEIDC